MDLKDFIKETLNDIASATRELQVELESVGVIVNPPLSPSVRDMYQHEDFTATYRRVELVEFDVALTVSTERAGGGKAGVKVFSLEAGADGKYSDANEQVSRVKFSVPIVLAPTKVEIRNRIESDKQWKDQEENDETRSSTTGY